MALGFLNLILFVIHAVLIYQLLCLSQVQEPKVLPLSVKSYDSKEKECLKEMLYYEARGLSKAEQEAILDVTVNRFRSKRYPDTFCGVIKQPWQFSYRNGVKYSEIILPEIQKLNQNSPDAIALVQINQIVENRLARGEIAKNKYLSSNVLHFKLKGVDTDWHESGKRVKVPSGFKHEFYSGVQ